MKKIYFLLFFLIPFLHFSQGPPPPGLPDPPVAAPINQIDSILFITAIFLGLYFTFRKFNLSLIPKKKTTGKIILSKTDNNLL